MSKGVGRKQGKEGENEIKGKNSSEITELFIFPALSLWAFEASTLMYLDILGPSVTRGHPSPPKARRFHQQQLPPPRLPTDPFEVGPGGVYPPSRKKRVQGGGSWPRVGLGRKGSPHHSPACLFGSQSGPFSTYYSTSSPGQPILTPEGEAGITSPRLNAPLLPGAHSALGFHRPASEGQEDTRLVPGRLSWSTHPGTRTSGFKF